jgi:SH3-like domain-containing protein
MLNRSLKTALAAGLVMIATAGTALAAPLYGYLEDDARVRGNHSTYSPTVNWVVEGDRVLIVGEWGNWYKVKIPGPDGWVRKSMISFHRQHNWDDDWNDNWGNHGGPGVSSSFCLNNDNAQFCFGMNN